ncbi:MAG: MBL fold metallo-hydrolase [Ruminococcaceae bacterium]|nr:MBL fold metallo-hydrolase [Oscillospiraceae bacterium]
MLIKGIEVGNLETNCYIVTDEKTLNCAIIDPGDESNTILDYIESNNLRPVAIMLTHAHFDHTGAAETIAEELDIPVWMHEEEYDNSGKYDPYRYQGSHPEFYKEGDVIKVGELGILVIETPGHSLGSVTLMCGDAMFCGDTLFRDSCGRTDLPGGDTKQILKSLKRLSRITKDYEVYPGHGEYTTLDREKKFNPYVRYANGEK